MLTSTEKKTHESLRLRATGYRATELGLGLRLVSHLSYPGWVLLHFSKKKTHTTDNRRGPGTRQQTTDNTQKRTVCETRYLKYTVNMNASGESSNSLILILTIGLVIMSTIFVFFSFQKKSKEKNSEPLTLELDSSGWDEVPPTTTTTTLRENGPTKESKGQSIETKTVPHRSPKKMSNETDEKPFSSSYYYAHNHLKKTGGYKDGIKAEDYQMNKPKLLSKTSSEVDSTESSMPVFFGIRINRYLWDDDDSYDGIARIIIDSIPSNENSSSSSIQIKDAGIRKEDVKCKLVGTWNNSLMVQIRRIVGDNELKYFFYIARMYGEVEDVKPIVKAKKIIIKLIKKRNPDNLKVWPQLPSNLNTPASSAIEFQDLFAIENS